MKKLLLDILRTPVLILGVCGIGLWLIGELFARRDPQSKLNNSNREINK